MQGALYGFEDVQSEIRQRGNTLCAVLYANSQARVAGYLALAAAIQSHGHLCFLVHPHNAAPSLEEVDTFIGVKRASIKAAAIAQLEGVDVFVSPEVVFDVSPTGAATVAIHHSLPEHMLPNYSNSVARCPTIVREMDYLVIALKQRSGAWTTANYAPTVEVYPPEFLVKRRAVLDIVPAGYPKIDYLEQMIGETDIIDTILITPTRIAHKESQLREQGARLISALLKRFPAYRIVLRPYPHPEDIAIGRQVASKFEGSGRFVLDESMTGLEHQKRSAVVVTDRSSSALSFSLATGRPSVFVNLQDTNTSYDQRMEFFGFRTLGIAAAIAAVDCCLRTRDYWRDSIRDRRGTYLYNPGKASDYIAQRLPIFAKRLSDPTWLSIPRKPWLRAQDKEESIRHLQRLRDGRQNTSSLMRTYQELKEYIEGIHGEIEVPPSRVRTGAP